MQRDACKQKLKTLLGVDNECQYPFPLIQICGLKGMGKTTALRDLVQEMDKAVVSMRNGETTEYGRIARNEFLTEVFEDLRLNAVRILEGEEGDCDDLGELMNIKKSKMTTVENFVDSVLYLIHTISKLRPELSERINSVIIIIDNAHILYRSHLTILSSFTVLPDLVGNVLQRDTNIHISVVLVSPLPLPASAYNRKYDPPLVWFDVYTKRESIAILSSKFDAWALPVAAERFAITGADGDAPPPDDAHMHECSSVDGTRISVSVGSYGGEEDDESGLSLDLEESDEGSTPSTGDDSDSDDDQPSMMKMKRKQEMPLETLTILWDDFIDEVLSNLYDYLKSDFYLQRFYIVNHLWPLYLRPLQSGQTTIYEETLGYLRQDIRPHCKSIINNWGSNHMPDFYHIQSTRNSGVQTRASHLHISMVSKILLLASFICSYTKPSNDKLFLRTYGAIEGEDPLPASRKRMKFSHAKASRDRDDENGSPFTLHRLLIIYDCVHICKNGTTAKFSMNILSQLCHLLRLGFLRNYKHQQNALTPLSAMNNNSDIQSLLKTSFTMRHDLGYEELQLCSCKQDDDCMHVYTQR
eukprot:GHVO01017160.1.p1 GENE.GHVO01017160.1~~GHVO01017160.1.p1  ORF type:complete len:584 (+),score=87.25 GHVO01017160.1:459-2210(+)